MAKLVYVDPKNPEESRKKPTPLVTFYKDLFHKSLKLHILNFVISSGIIIYLIWSAYNG